MDKLIAWDTKLLIWLNNMGVDWADNFWIAISEVNIWIPFYALLLALMARHLKWKSFGWGLLFIILLVFATDQGSVQLFKEQFQRLRPCHVDEVLEQIRLVKGSCGGKYGFLSSHASNTFGLAVFLSMVFKTRWPWFTALMLFWAALVSYSRVYLGVHYPLDILAGAGYGSLCGALIYGLFARLVKPEKRDT